VLRRATPLVFLVATLSTACTSESHPATPAGLSPSTRLATLAAQGAGASYTATYQFHQASPDTTATVQVWRADPLLRVDVVAAGTTATLLRTSSGSYSCAMTSAKRTCLLVAGPNQPLPKPFDIAPANLFTTDLAQLSEQTGLYDVTAAPASTASGPAAGARCFDVAPKASGASAGTSASASASPSPSPSASSPAATVPAGRYCFTADGLLAGATYPSGNTVLLTNAQVGSPPAAQFTPYAKPTPLPS